MALADMNVKVGADIKDLEDGMSRAGGSTEKFADRTKKALAGTTGSFNNLSKSSNSATFALTNLGRVAQDLPYGFVGIQNNLNPLLESFQRLKAESGSSGKALKALGSSLIGAGGIGLALSVASAAILLFQNGMANFSKKTKAASDEVTEANKKLADSYKSIVADAAQEATRVAVIVEQLKQEVLTRKQRAGAIEELKRISPEYFSLLDKEKATIEQITSSYNQYSASIVRAITAKLREKQIEEVTGKILDLQKKRVDFTKQEVDEDGKLVVLKNKIYNAEVDGETEYQKFARGRGLLTKEQNTELKNLLLTQKALIEQQAISGEKDFKVAGGTKEKIKKKAKEEAIIYTETLQHALSELLTGPKDLTEDIFKTSRNKISPIGQIFPTDEIIRAGIALEENQAKLDRTATFVQSTLTPVFDQLFTSILDGSQTAFQAFGNALKTLIVQLAATVAKAAALAAIMAFVFPGSTIGKAGFGALFNKFLGFAEGGEVKGRGSGTSDSIPARLSAGEYVIKASTVKQFGVGFFDQLNKGGKPNLFGNIPKFALGGFVSPSLAGSIGGGQQIFIAKSVIRGQDIVTTYQRASGTINRNT